MKKFAEKFRAALDFAPLPLFAAFAIIIAPGSVCAEVIRFKVDPARSIVSASVVEPVAFIRGHAVGMFRVIDGDISGDPKNIPATARVRISIDAASYRSDNPKRDRAVTQKALESGKFPTIEFDSTSVVGVVETGPNQGLAIVSGLLNLHGEARATTFPVQATLGADGTLVAEGEVKFDYEDYRIKVPGLLFGAFEAGDEVTVRFHIVAATAQAVPEKQSAAPAISAPRPAQP